MRAFTATPATETNTFAPLPTGLSAFHAPGHYFKAGTHPPEPTALSSWMLAAGRERARRESWTLAEGMMSFAEPAGVTTREAWDTLREELLADLRAAMPVDLVLLALHGAMVAEGCDDCEGELLRQVRGIVGRDGAGSFMGTGFSIGDLARTRFQSDYTAALVSESPASDVLKLTPKASDAHDHAALIVTIRREDSLVSRIEAVDAAGKAIRTLVASDFRAVGGYTVAHHVDVLEHAARRKTTAQLESVQFDTGLSPDFFTERELRRAP